MAESPTTSSSAERVLDVLFAFTISAPALTAAEVAQCTGINRSTAHRMLQLLESKLLVQHPVGDPARYELAPRVLQLSEVVLHQLDDLRSVALSHLTSLRDRTGETAALHVRQHDSRVGVTQVESEHQLRRTYSDLGRDVPLYLGAPSLAMLAFLPAAHIARCLPSDDEPWPSIGAHDRDEMLGWLARIRADGYAVSRAHRLAGIVSVAAPVRNRYGDVIAAINVTGPEVRFTDATLPSLIEAVLIAASDLEGRMGYTPDPIHAMPARDNQTITQ